MNKGFTLIELLAVIVILAIIALIATPIIINIINDSQKSAAANSAQLYVDGLVKQVMSENMNGEFNPSSCTISNGSVTCDETSIDYSTSGDKPTSGTITFTNGVVTGYTINISGYTVTKSGTTITATKGETVIAPVVVPITTFLDDDFEDYAENTTVVSGSTSFSLQYNGTGDGNQKVITSTQPDDTSGMVLQLQGNNSWSSEVRYYFTPDEEQYIVLEGDIKPISGITPGGFRIGSSGASGTWVKGVCGIAFSNGGFYLEVNDTATAITTDVTYTSETWHHVKLVLDTTNDLCYISINGTLLDSNGFEASSAIPSWITLIANNSGVNTTYFDNVRLYSTDTSGL